MLNTHILILVKRYVITKYEKAILQVVVINVLYTRNVKLKKNKNFCRRKPSLCLNLNSLNIMLEFRI